MNKHYFITGIGTGIGKTIVSAILTEKLKADYWKPVQSGDLMSSDSLLVQSLLTNTNTKIHPEQYRLNYPLSPHLSAKMDGIEIELNEFIYPQTSNSLIIEGAGGLMVPLNDQHLILDLIKQLAVETIVVSQNYLGSINHTLLTLQVLKQNHINVKGIIFNGEANAESEAYILKYTQSVCLGRIPILDKINKANIIEAGKNLSF
ncbi:MAG: dethiobiotin synthase [Bacteroidota bacterium]